MRFMTNNKLAEAQALIVNMKATQEELKGEIARLLDLPALRPVPMTRDALEEAKVLIGELKTMHKGISTKTEKLIMTTLSMPVFNREDEYSDRPSRNLYDWFTRNLSVDRWARSSVFDFLDEIRGFLIYAEKSVNKELAADDKETT